MSSRSSQRSSKESSQSSKNSSESNRSSHSKNSNVSSKNSSRNSNHKSTSNSNEKRKALSQPTIAATFENARKKRKVDEEEEEFTLNKHDINETEKEKLIADLMRFVLFKDHQKLPVLKKDINAKVLGEYAKKRNVTNVIIKEAQKRFEDTFGFKMVEIQKSTSISKRKAPTKNSGASGTYVLINVLPQEDNNGELLNWNFTAPYTGLLMAVLCLIYINNNVIEQELLYQLLSKLRLSGDHPVLHSWNELIEKQFVKQLYLHRTKVVGKFDKKGDPVYEYRSGPRAKLEISNVKILDFISRVFGDELTQQQLEQLASNYSDDEEIEYDDEALSDDN